MAVLTVIAAVFGFGLRQIVANEQRDLHSRRWFSAGYALLGMLAWYCREPQSAIGFMVALVVLA